MNKVKAIILIEALIILFLIVMGLLQLAEIDSFWIFNFESLINIFITASLGVIGLYITVSIIENNTSKRRKLDFMEAQLVKLLNLLDSDIIKLSTNHEGHFPVVEDFLSYTQKMRDIISNIGHFIEIIHNSKEQYISLLANFEEFNQLADFYCDEAIKKSFKKTNQSREDMTQNISKILIGVYDAY